MECTDKIFSIVFYSEYSLALSGVLFLSHSVQLKMKWYSHFRNVTAQVTNWKSYHDIRNRIIFYAADNFFFFR